jgi:hypothetical protein
LLAAGVLQQRLRRAVALLVAQLHDDLVELAIERELGLGRGPVALLLQRCCRSTRTVRAGREWPPILTLQRRRQASARTIRAVAAARCPPPAAPPPYCITLTLKYFAAGWWQMIAEVLCSGTSWNSSLSATPMREASSSGSSRDWSSIFGQAG